MTQTPPPRPDPLIDEVRAIRTKLWDDCGHDFDRVAEQLREIQRRYAKRIRPVPEPDRRKGDRRSA